MGEQLAYIVKRNGQNVIQRLRPRRLPIYLVGLVESVGVEPTIVHVAALPIAYNPINVDVYIR